MLTDGERKLLWHDANDGVLHVIEPQPASKHRGIRREPFLPLIEADHDDVRAAAFIFVEQRSSQQRLHAHQPERGSRHLGDRYGTSCPVRSCEVALDTAHGAHIGYGPQPFTPPTEIL